MQSASKRSRVSLVVNKRTLPPRGQLFHLKKENKEELRKELENNVIEEEVIHLLLNQLLKSKRWDKGLQKIIALLNKVLLVITLIQNVQMFVKNVIIIITGLQII